MLLLATGWGTLHFKHSLSANLSLWFNAQIRKPRPKCPWKKHNWWEDVKFLPKSLNCKNVPQIYHLKFLSHHLLSYLFLLGFLSQMLKDFKERNRRNRLGAWMCEVFTAGISPQFYLSQLMWLSSRPGRGSAERRSRLCKRQWRNASDTSWPSSLMSKVNLKR